MSFKQLVPLSYVFQVTRIDMLLAISVLGIGRIISALPNCINKF